MTTTECSVSGCIRPVLCRAMCQRHYYYARRYGSPTPPPRYRTDLTGRRFGALVVLEFRSGNGGWTCRCDCGATTIVPTKNLTAGNTASCGCRRTARRDGPVGYNAAHDRLTVDRGVAADRECEDCGRPAAHWSYDHQDPDELVDHLGFPYSLDPDHYSARCASCHRRMDARRRTG